MQISATYYIHRQIKGFQTKQVTMELLRWELLHKKHLHYKCDH